jgi:tetratricopeptide (TPR) repeat protein
MKYNLYISDDLETTFGLPANETQKVIIVSPPYDYLNDLIDILKSLKNLTNYLNIMNSSFDIFYGLEPLYYNICYPKAVLKKYDVSLRSRREYLASKNIHLCQDGCLYEGDNLQYFQVICCCPLKINLEKVGFFSLIKKGILDIRNKHNFQVLKCYESISRIKDITDMFFFINFIFFLFISLLVGYFINKIYKLRNDFKKAIEYFKRDNEYNNLKKTKFF